MAPYLNRDLSENKVFPFVIICYPMSNLGISFYWCADANPGVSRGRSKRNAICRDCAYCAIATVKPKRFVQIVISAKLLIRVRL